MTIADIYLFCFGFGFLFSLVAVITGQLDLEFGGGGDDIGVDIDAGVDPGSPHHHVSAFNLGTIAAFLAWFGGTGYLATRFYSVWFVTTFAMAVVSGLVGAYLVYLFLTRVLMRSREELDPADYEMVGVLGQVSGTIRAEGIGEILFSQGGSRRAAPAKSDDGKFIAPGAEVVVTRYENGIAFVRRWEDLTGTSMD
jgi:membrane protein implicated in regulation of membrane protease activity